jgi:nitrate reductase NapE component
MSSEKHEKLLFIFIAGLLCLNWPLLEIFNTSVVAYLFSVWLAFIAVVAVAAHFNVKRGG